VPRDVRIAAWLRRWARHVRTLAALKVRGLSVYDAGRSAGRHR
jgi:hypothetical protein